MVSNFHVLLLWIAAPLGAAIGSFAVALDSRWSPTINWHNALSRPSSCDSCGKRVAWFDKIPLVSWLLLGGHARCCKAQIGFRETLGELLGSILMVALALTLREPSTYLAWSMTSLAVLSLATAIASGLSLALIDARTKRLPNPLVATLGVSGVAFACQETFLRENVESLIIPFASASAWFAAFLILRLSSRGGMGIGDLKLATALGFWLGIYGLPASVVGFFLAFTFGALHGLAQIVFRGASRKQQLPFGPAMLAASVTAIVLGNQIWSGYWQLVTGLAI